MVLFDLVELSTGVYVQHWIALRKMRSEMVDSLSLRTWGLTAWEKIYLIYLFLSGKTHLDPGLRIWLGKSMSVGAKLVET